MAKGTNQKLKLIYLIRMLLEKTDEEHSVTMQEILEYLSANDITAERKSIYDDLEAIRNLGFDVVGEPHGKTFHYHIVSRQFELAELKLLVDAIQSSKFITERKSRELIKKLESLVSVYEAKQLQRQVYVSGRIKTMNESIYYNIDELHNAIAQNKKIQFQYFQWNLKKEMELRRDGKFYVISPWALSWMEENYYLIGYDADEGKIKHFRVDKMLKIGCLEEAREGRELFDRFDMAAYSKKNFGMYGGQEQTVKLLCHNSLVGVIIDRFGKDVMIVPADEEHFHVNVEVAVSGLFLGWIFALGDKIRIIGPDAVVEEMRDMIKKSYYL